MDAPLPNAFRGISRLPQNILGLLLHILDNYANLGVDPATITFRRLRQRLIIAALLSNSSAARNIIALPPSD